MKSGIKARQSLKNLIKLIPGKQDQGKLYTHLVTSTVGTFTLKVTSTGLAFLTNLLLARLLGATGYGAYAYAMAWVGLLSVPATLGFHQLLVRNVAIYHAQENWSLMQGLLRFSNRVVLITSIVLMAAAAPIGWVLFGSKNEYGMLHALWLALLMLPITALTQLRQSALRGLHQIIRGQLPEMLIRPLLLVSFIASAYLLFHQYLSALLAVLFNVVATLIALAVASHWLGKVLPEEVKTVEPETRIWPWIRNALPLLLVASIQIINFQIDFILLGAFKGAEQVGVYAIVKRVTDIIVFVLSAVEVTIAPSIASLYAREQTVQLQQMISNTAKIILAVAVPIVAVLVAFGKSILSLFGSDFMSGQLALVVLSVGQLMNAGFGPVGQLAIHTGNENGTALIVGLAALMNILLNLLLIPKWGVVGAAMATAVSLAVWNLLLSVFVYRRTGIISVAFHPRSFWGVR
ncbi:flippase [Calderihabitans maritimus]|nr:flippase [Calderihabitans maritimus]